MEMLNLNYTDNIVSLSEETQEGKREYTINGKKYVSVTTMLSKTKDTRFLTEWRNRVGHEEAQKITTAAAQRGTLMHKEIENWFERGEEGKSAYFLNIRHFLPHIKPIFFERVVYSDLLNLAGRVDCFGHYNNELSIIDFKTSAKIKKKEWIEDYFLQCTAYSLCIEEMFQEKVKQLVILMATETHKKDFVESRKAFILPLYQRVKRFKQLSS